MRRASEFNFVLGVPPPCAVVRFDVETCVRFALIGEKVPTRRHRVRFASETERDVPPGRRRFSQKGEKNAPESGQTQPTVSLESAKNSLKTRNGPTEARAARLPPVSSQELLRSNARPRLCAAHVPAVFETLGREDFRAPGKQRRNSACVSAANKARRVSRQPNCLRSLERERELLPRLPRPLSSATKRGLQPSNSQC